MKKHSIINNIIASALLYAGVVSASDYQGNDTDLIYGGDKLVPDKGETYIPATSVQNNQAEDIIYGDQKLIPARGEAPERIANSRDNNTDLIYGS